MKLHNYQEALILALWQYFRERKPDMITKPCNPLLVAPTGSGKSVIIAAIIKELTQKWKMRVLVVTHQKELITQNFQRYKTFHPEGDAGIYSASAGYRHTANAVIFAGVQSIYNKAAHFGNINAVLVDECHLIPQNGSGMYNTLINDLRTICGKNIPIIGLTATPYRLDSGMLHKGEGALFTDIAHEIDINELLDAGYLSPLTTKSTGVVIDTNGIKKRGGDFVISDLELAADAVTEAAITDALPRLEGRKSIIIFCVTVDHALHVKDLLDDCEVVCGDTPAKLRDQLLADFKAGKIRFLASVNVLTTGFDAPNVDGIIMLRPTQSKGLYVQMLGRGLRIAENKKNCLVLDYAENVARHGFIDQIKAPDEVKKGEGSAPVKVCPSCEEICAASVRLCPSCEHEFPPPELELTKKPSDKVLFSRDYEPVEYTVSRMTYAKHIPVDDNKMPTMRVSYFDDTGVFPIRVATQYICIFHKLGSYAYLKAQSWCNERGMTVEKMRQWCEGDDDITPPLEPIAIKVDSRGQFEQIVGYTFED